MIVNRYSIIHQMFCRHKRDWKFYPEDVQFVNTKAGHNEPTHGLVIYCCMNCGRLIARDYAK